MGPLNQRAAGKAMISRVLGVLKENGKVVTDELVSKLSSYNVKDFVIKSELLRLEKLGLIQREVLDENDPLNCSSWSLTHKGRNELRSGRLESQFPEKTEPRRTEARVESLKEVRIVTTCPRELRKQFERLEVQDSVETLKQLLLQADREIKIVTPYLDNVIIDRFEGELERIGKKGVKIRLIFRDYNLQTQNAIDALKEIFENNFSWRRISTPVAQGVRGQSARGIHAKFIVIDRKIALITSMNLTVNSMNYNMEIGAMIANPGIVRQIDEIFEVLWEASNSRTHL